MSPSQAQHQQETMRDMINADSRLTTLKVNKNSHIIHKASSSSFLSEMAIIGDISMASDEEPPQRQPVVVYAKSPKIIHTNVRDFKALVQKLTGLSSNSKGHSDLHGKDGHLVTAHGMDPHKNISTKMMVPEKSSNPVNDNTMNNDQIKMRQVLHPIHDSIISYPHNLYKYTDSSFCPSYVESSLYPMLAVIKPFTDFRAV